jgi:transcriptional regulator
VYIPAAFAQTHPEVLAHFIRHNSFGTLVTSHPDHGLCASHIPFLLSQTPGHEQPTLIAHVARQNDQWRALRQDTDVLVLFQGPHAYISPRFYQATLAVPTWNYTAVHVYGRPRLIEDPAAVRQVLTDTVTTFEGTGPAAWKDSNLPAEFMEKLSTAIVAFAIDVTRIEGKFKLNQNRPLADRLGVIAALETTPGDDAHAIAALMRAQLNDRQPPPENLPAPKFSLPNI